MDKTVLTLLRNRAYIDGQWVGEPRFPVLDKATGDEIARVPDLGRDETRYLEPLDHVMESGHTPAERLLEKFNGAWKHSIDPVYSEYAF